MNPAESLDRRSRASGRAPTRRPSGLQPAVAETVVGEEICDVVTPRSGVRAEADELREFVRGKVAAYKYPRIVEEVEAFPETSTGKILEHEFKLEARA